MPIYEFKCAQCNLVFSELRKVGEFTPPECPGCGSHTTEKVFSLFAGGKSECGSCAVSHPGG